MSTEREVGGIRCFEVLARLDAYAAGELDAASLRAVQLHVAGCTSCERFGAAYVRTLAALRALPAPLADPGVAQRLRARLGG